MSQHWGSKLGFVLAAAGSAIGLGNIWRFPYIAGQNGGGAFLIVYLICAFTLGYVMILGKIVFGRAAKTDFVGGFSVIAQKAGKTPYRIWGFLGGWLGIISTFLIASIYSIIIGWTFSYMVKSFQILIGSQKMDTLPDHFEQISQSFPAQFVCGIICLALAFLILSRGIKKGIEKISTVLMPVLFILLIVICLCVWQLPDADKGIRFFLTPHFESIGFTQNGFDIHLFLSVVLTAMGQAIYSLSMGMGILFIYGSYLPDKTHVRSAAASILCLDFMVAFLSGLIVFPAVFAFGMEPGSGPGLTFQSLPLVFGQMTGGTFVSFGFFTLLFIAALTSLISIFEPMINLIINRIGLPRKKACLYAISFGAAGFSAVLTADWLHIKAGSMSFFDLLDKLTGSFTLGLTMIVCCLFIGWVGFTPIIRNLKSSDTVSRGFVRIFKHTMRWIAPGTLIILMLGQLF